VIEANEDRTRDWRHAYHTRIRDHRKRLEEARAAGLNRLSDRAITREAYALAEREVQTALNHEAARAARKNLPRHEREQDPDAPAEDITELPPVMSKADLYDDGVIQPVDEI